MKLNAILKYVLFLSLFSFAINAGGIQAADVTEETSDKKEKEVYHDATFENFSKAYWRFRKFDIEDNQAIDNYMRINECDLYKEYFHNEFEWTGIRNATKEFLVSNNKKFPENFQFMQPISLGEYDFEKKGFKLAEEYALHGVKRFEITSDKLGANVCGDIMPIYNYPKVIALELTRPLTFDFFEVDPGLAEDVLSEKMDEYENLPAANKTRKSFLDAREVYMIAKVKMFAYKPEDFQHRQGYYLAKMLGILEEIEVYADKDKKQLLFRKDLRRKKRTKTKEF